MRGEYYIYIKTVVQIKFLLKLLKMKIIPVSIRCHYSNSNYEIKKNEENIFINLQ